MKKIKELNHDEMRLFSEPFRKSSVTFTRHDAAWKVISPSEEFRNKIMRVECSSGALLKEEIDPAIMRGMAIYRYDPKDESKGTPVNVDLYLLKDFTLFKIQSSNFKGHHLATLPKEQ